MFKVTNYSWVTVFRENEILLLNYSLTNLFGGCVSVYPLYLNSVADEVDALPNCVGGLDPNIYL